MNTNINPFDMGILNFIEKKAVVDINKSLLPSRPKTRNREIEHETMSNYVRRIESDPTISTEEKRMMIGRMFNDVPPPGVIPASEGKNSLLGAAAGGGLGLAIAPFFSKDMSPTAKTIFGLGLMLGGGALGSSLLGESGTLSPLEGRGDYSKWTLV